MGEISTLTEMMEFRARKTPDQEAFLFAGNSYAYADVWQRAGELGAHLRDLGVGHGDRVVLVLPNGPEFFYGFYGVLRLGAIAVPIFPGSGPDQIAARARLCQSRTVVVPTDTPADKLALLIAACGDGGPTVTSCPSPGSAPLEAELPRVVPADIAMLQYTSGSTGNPKGVQLSHGNLMTNVHQMIAGMEITSDEIFVSWLPVYHDMGLILKTMVPFFLGARLVLLPTSLTNVRTWLQSIDEHKGTFTAAPDFAYRLCPRYVRDPERYDISSLRVALNAAEPVRSSTIENFERVFGIENVIVGGYGLAEATVGVCMWSPGTPARVDARGLVSVGRPFPAVEFKIVDGDRELEDGEIGTILIRSPANTCGYWENPAATADLMREDGYIDSGDLGLLDGDGNLYIAGRRKNIIITAGRNIAPQELEEIVDTLAEVRFSAALGVDRGRIEGEQPYLFAEIRPGGSEAAWEQLTVKIVALIHERLGLRPGRVFLLEQRTIPQTHNGKIQHQLLKERYLSGALRRDGKIIFPDY